MTTNINASVLKNFITSTIGGNRLDAKQAEKFDIDADKYAEVNADENDYIDLNEILDDKDVYQMFAVMYEEEQEVKNQGKEKEKEKEEQIAVKDKNGAGV